MLAQYANDTKTLLLLTNHINTLSERIGQPVERAETVVSTLSVLIAR